MDHFGIGTGVLGAVEVYFRCSGGTGRTSSLVYSVKSGDRIVFINEEQATRFRGLCKERGLEVETVVCNPEDISSLFGKGSVSGEGRLIFDHVWVEQYYIYTIQQAMLGIDHLQREIGGFGEAHHRTIREAKDK